LVALRPLSLAGLMQARKEIKNDALAAKIDNEITAITKSAIHMQPRMRIFYDKLTGAPKMQEPVKDPFYDRSFSRDLYFILQDARKDGTATLRFFVKPHMTMGIAGLMVLVFGTVMAFLPSFRRRRAA
jgi:cytochrome c biogenesis factor